MNETESKAARPSRTFAFLAKIAKQFRKSDYGEWIAKTPLRGSGKFGTVMFGVLLVFCGLYIVLLYIFESGVLGEGGRTGSVHFIGVAITNSLAIAIGFVLSKWWQTESEVGKKREEATRIQSKYSGDLVSLAFVTAEIGSALSHLPDKSRSKSKDINVSKFLVTSILLFFRRRFHEYAVDVTGLGFQALDLQREQHHVFQDIANSINSFLRKFPQQMQSEILEAVVPISALLISEGGEVKVKAPDPTPAAEGSEESEKK